MSSPLSPHQVLAAMGGRRGGHLPGSGGSLFWPARLCLAPLERVLKDAEGAAPAQHPRR